VRGLGGGIEYAVAAEVCANLIPLFIDEPRPTCDQLQQAVQRAFTRWGERHPALRFVNLSARLHPQLPPSEARDPWRGFGAEIDLFALSPEQYPRVRGLGAWTGFWFLFADPVGTNGRVLPGNTITSADIVLNTRSCYHLDPALAGRGCNHFESLVLHEIGHTLGLHHPAQSANRNFDSDEDPSNIIPIDCQEPTRGLRLSPNIDQRAVMNSGLGQPMPVLQGLTNDDLGGRDFHYPICPSAHSTSALNLDRLWWGLLAALRSAGAKFTASATPGAPESAPAGRSPGSSR
jgi:hypothetical protein